MSVEMLRRAAAGEQPDAGRASGDDGGGGAVPTIHVVIGSTPLETIDRISAATRSVILLLLVAATFLLCVRLDHAAAALDRLTRAEMAGAE